MKIRFEDAHFYRFQIQGWQYMGSDSRIGINLKWRYGEKQDGEVLFAFVSRKVER